MLEQTSLTWLARKRFAGTYEPQTISDIRNLTGAACTHEE
jgi:hypothetical protein